jgi:hypothetical protein
MRQPMVRLLFIGAVVLLAACGSGGSMCRDLCSESMPCTGGKFQCVGSLCLVQNDAGPPNCGK